MKKQMTNHRNDEKNDNWIVKCSHVHILLTLTTISNDATVIKVNSVADGRRFSPMVSNLRSHPPTPLTPLSNLDIPKYPGRFWQ